MSKELEALEEISKETHYSRDNVNKVVKKLKDDMNYYYGGNNNEIY